MKLTNQFGLPEPFFRAVLNDKYSRGHAHYSVTDLIRPPRITILSRRHWEEIEEDVSERIWALLGRAVHAILEAAEPDNALTEERLFAEVAGRTISGASDLFHDGVVSDYKVTSIWTRIFGSKLKDWTLQLNFYAFLFRQIGFPVQALKIICIYRDWTSTKATQDDRCPKMPVEVIQVPLWSFEEQEQEIQKRVELLKTLEAMSDDQLLPCTPEEMWEKPTAYAVMKPGRRAALRVYASQALAEGHAKNNTGLFIQVRPGERTRCEKYCAVKRFCTEFAQYRAAKQSEG